MSIQSNPAKHTLLEGSRRAHRPGAQVLGRADPHEWAEITLKLRRKSPLPEPVRGQAVLTQEAAAADYGADPADIEKVATALEGYGLTILSKDPVTRTVKAAGAVDRMEAIFQTHLLRVKHGDVLYRGRVGNLSVPAELAGLIQGVFGLDTRPMIRRRGKARPIAPQAQLPPPNQRPWFLPQELAEAYGFPGHDGAGQSIGVIELGGSYIASDLTAFAQITGLGAAPPVSVVNVNMLSASDANNPDAIGEVMLDTEVVAAVCPGAKDIVLYFAPFTEKGWVDVIDAALSDTIHHPAVLSISYGLAEGSLNGDIWTQAAMDAVNDSMQEAAARGIPVCVAAGDDGSDDQVGDGQAHVNFPASSPYVLAVGGTALVKSASGTTEKVWFDGDGLRADGGGSTGGGVSAVFPKPTWQAEIDIPSVNPGAIAGRIIPDVSADAAGSTGYFMVSSGQPQVSGGTSAATPLWAALIARLLEAGAPIGYLTPIFYEAAPDGSGDTVGLETCNDITQGNNDTAAAGGYSAGPGFDAVTGWGSPKGAALARLLPQTSATATAPTPGPKVPVETHH
ncbi:MAG TPA: S53 family peptidase [Caulobacteraceae bacterium]|nr:S53 family peptidase [Caulobacteraceae bacterium]